MIKSNNTRNVKRLIIDSKKLTPELVALVREKYPDGYFEDDIIVFKNHKNETIEAIEVEKDDVIYLIKIGRQLNVELESFDADIDVDSPTPKDIDIDLPSDDDEEEKDEQEDITDEEDEQEEAEDGAEEDDEQDEKE